MRVAIVHDWLYIVGGAERVLEQLLRIYLDADVFALFDFLPDADRARLGYTQARTSFIQRMPFARTRHRNYLPLMPLAIEQFDLSAYDLVISSSYAVAKGVLTGPDQLHVSYIHSPMRYAWDMQHTYLRESGCDAGMKSLLARLILHRMRVWDFRTAAGPNAIVANSAFVARRIHKVYGRTAEVIHPPITLPTLRYDGPRANHFLVASRLVPYKNVEAVIRAFALLPDLELVVAGSGPDAARLREIAGPNVTFSGFVPDAELRHLMATARAFIFAAEEDFGIIVVEATSEGTPVLALGRGGARETVQTRGPQRTGMFFDVPEPEAIAECVRRFLLQESHFTREACWAQAETFSAELFRSRFSNFVDDQMALHRAACETRPRIVPRLEAVG
ncbi:glycosyltransferase [Methylobacterium radiotolerans]|jgi:glycosyltransferase involved in cell wall biosynthesis|uniref:glycosyltransferase n=1 Tax=Methylobacterium TaxID=407 RepID=UPI0005E11598|nr:MULTISPECIES: glycosyltransferase [Methylobacterium]MBN6818081.1 glycosyltransferase [Methylobacterium organophilum]OXE43716.1 glycosyltransferase family 4 protein [Methylobacterium radiotolerans]GAN46436.1 putative glycosyl transferase [Methylobacterium sp. ME121]